MAFKRKRKESFLVEIYKDFAQNTSIHGLKYTVSKETSIYEKLFWFVVVSCGLLGAVYMTVLFWNRYQSNPTRTSVLTNFAPTTQFSFPAVTVCNINRIVATKVDNYIQKLDLFGEDVDLVRSAFFQLIAFTNPAWTESYNITELNILQKILEKNDVYDYNQVMRKVTQTCKEMLLKCMWEGETVDCTTIFKESFTLDGLCCSFNYNIRNSEPPIHTFYSDYYKGLSVLLNPMVQSVKASIFSSVGMMVYIHRSKDYPSDGDIKKIVSVGRQTLLGVSATQFVTSDDVRSLDVNQRKCVFPEEHKLKYFVRYSDTNCEVECFAGQLMGLCGCVPYYYDFADGPICDISKIPCLENYTENSDDCDCPLDCEDLYYDVVSTSTALVRGDYETSPFLDSVDVSVEKYVYVNIYFARPIQVILKRDTITSALYLFASFGGVYSLFMGCSFITCIEIVYYATLRVYVRMKFVNNNTKGVEGEAMSRGRRIPIRNTISVIPPRDSFVN